MARKRLLFVLSIVFLLVVLLVEACASGSPVPAPGATPATPRPPAAGASPAPTPAPAKPRTIRMMWSGEPAHLRFSEFIYTAAEIVARNVMEPLLDVGKKGEPVPKLATKWERVNPTTWRMYLRKGVKFHNGADFTASDVVESARWVIDLKEIGGIYPRVPFSKAVAVDDYTVDIIFENPQPLFLLNARFFVIYPAAMARDNRDAAALHPVGTGPYEFVKWDKGQKMEIARFDGYWGPKPSIDKAEMFFRGEGAVRAAALSAKEVDWVYGLSTVLAGLAPKVVTLAGEENYHLRLDESVQKDPILADERLRLAIDYAIDRQKLIDLFGGFAKLPQGQFAIPGDFGYNADLKARPYDLEKARALVREAGAVGKSVTFVVAAKRFNDRETGEAVAAMIQATGLNVKLMFVAAEEDIKWVVTTGQYREYMADITFSAGDHLLEVESRYARILHKNGNQYALNDPEASRLFEEVLAEVDVAKRGEKLARAWGYAYEHAHFIPLIKPDFIWGLAKNLEWDPDLMGRPVIGDFRFTD